MKKDHKVSNFIFGVTVLATLEASKQRSTASSSSSKVFKLMAYFIIPLVLYCFVATADSFCNQIDKDSLLAFSNNLTLSSPYLPLNWSGSIDCCSWEGIFCAKDKDKGDQRVVNVLLTSRGLGGSISASLSNLTALSQLNLSHNRFSGILPTTIFSLLNHLQILDLSHNRLSGELPNFVANNNSSSSVINEVDLSSNLLHGMIPSSFLQQLGLAAAGGSLTYFNISNNSFTGQFPLSFFCINENNSSSLGYLDFSFNKFIDKIPSGLGACSKLEIFRAGFNSLTGPLPNDIYDAISLTEISLAVNELSGTIDDGITRLTNLTTLELYFNQLVGQIPPNIGKLSKLEHLLLHTNNLTGTLPPSLMNCLNLVTLNLRANFLEGNLSDFNFSGFLKLTTLDLGFNGFTGNFPSTLFSCKSLSTVRVSHNMLEGQISPDILRLQSLSFLVISENKFRNFTGTMRILTGLKNLTILGLCGNFNEEVMPDDENLIGPDDFQKLQVLCLASCNFTGSIPSCPLSLRNSRS